MSEGTKKQVSLHLDENITYMEQLLCPQSSYDLLTRELYIADKKACMYFINGFCKEDLMQKIIQHLMGITKEQMPQKVEELIQTNIPYTEVDVVKDFDQILYYIFSGVLVLIVDGYKQAITIDARSYPSRNVDEPAKDRTLRGSKDGFVETLVCNTALIRRRIRDAQLRMEIMQAGKASKTDMVICYMDDRVDHAFLEEIKQKIAHIQVDALTMSQQSLAECLYPYKWYNPFPKIKYTERPDTAAAQVLEGNILIIVDNAPVVMIMPTSFFDVVEEADDYYFPPITGTYLRFSRFLITALTYLIAPTFLLLMQNPEWIPKGLEFIAVQGTIHVPLVWQFLILELAIDGLRLAAVNTPNMLSTPLSIMAGLVLGEFSVESGWFNAEVMLYMAFVAISSYTQPNYEMSYALKFMRMITLVLTSIFHAYGYTAGILFTIWMLLSNRTVSKQSYLYPLIPFNWKKLKHLLLRVRLPGSRKSKDI